VISENIDVTLKREDELFFETLQSKLKEYVKFDQNVGEKKLHLEYSFMWC
jgi:hypothetical protein